MWVGVFFLNTVYYGYACAYTQAIDVVGLRNDIGESGESNCLVTLTRKFKSFLDFFKSWFDWFRKIIFLHQVNQHPLE